MGRCLVRLPITPVPTAQDNLAATIKPDRMIVLPVALREIPIHGSHETRSALLSITDQDEQEMPSGELARGFM